MANAPSSKIYDLGYQGYNGPRLGRQHAVIALYDHSLRAIFGFGRSGWAKLQAFGILGIALLPAVIQLGVAAISPEDVELTPPEDYYGLIQPLIAVFCALIAPDLVGRDQRTQVISLYFSRALRREDYALAKYAAFVTSVLALIVIPQLLMFSGNAAASDDVLDWIQDNARDLPAILVSGVLLACLVAGIGLTVAAYVTRRAYATVAIAAVFLLSSVIAAAVFEAAGADTGKYVLLLSPFHIAQGMTYWLFGGLSDDNDQIFEADLFGGVYVLASIVISAVTLALLVQRFRRVEA
jgi:ABC-2 type transport system permease protein